MTSEFPIAKSSLSQAHLVIVTYDWPPRNAIATFRPLSWVRAWSPHTFKHITVITARKMAFDEPLDYPVEEFQNTSIIEVPYGNISGTLASSLLKRNASGFFGRFLRVTQDVMGSTVNPRKGWERAAKSVTAALAQSADIVISTHGPPEAHLIASHMKRSNSALVWIADYRDMWSLTAPDHSKDEWQQSKQSKVEISTVGALADCVTAVSEENASALARFLRRPTQVVMNGYEHLYPPAQQLQKKARNRPFFIVYTGNIYSTHRNPMPLFQAVQLLREQLESAPDLRIQFYGSRLDSIYQLVNENGLSGFVDIKGYVSKQEAQRVQQDADALLLLEAGTPGVLTGKLFEYIASGRPIIAIGPKQESAIGRLLSETGTGIALGTDRSLIVNELSSLIQETPPSWFRPRESKIAQYSRTAQADRLLKTVEELWRERLHSKGITQRH